MDKTLVKVRMWIALDEVEVQVDKGATTVVLPPSIGDELHLIRTGKTRVRYADEGKSPDMLLLNELERGER